MGLPFYNKVVYIIIYYIMLYYIILLNGGPIRL